LTNLATVILMEALGTVNGRPAGQLRFRDW
jgi:hypothetical protein